jgi:hypothetical protein
MCQREGLSLQRGMNFGKLRPHSVVLSSHCPNAPYNDRIEEEGRVLIYEGHDEPKTSHTPRPKDIDQPACSAFGRPTENGLFLGAAETFKNGGDVRYVRVYEKIKPGIWSYNGLFRLEDAWQESDGRRRVFKFLLRLAEMEENISNPIQFEKSEPQRIIPSAIKLAVWKRDGGKCVECGETTELHFDHILPYSKGGTSFSVDNIQLLCMRHNLMKSARIQ